MSELSGDLSPAEMAALRKAFQEAIMEQESSGRAYSVVHIAREPGRWANAGAVAAGLLMAACSFALGFALAHFLNL